MRQLALDERLSKDTDFSGRGEKDPQTTQKIAYQCKVFTRMQHKTLIKYLLTEKQNIAVSDLILCFSTACNSAIFLKPIEEERRLEKTFHYFQRITFRSFKF